MAFPASAVVLTRPLGLIGPWRRGQRRRRNPRSPADFDCRRFCGAQPDRPRPHGELRSPRVRPVGRSYPRSTLVMGAFASDAAPDDARDGRLVPPDLMVPAARIPYSFRDPGRTGSTAAAPGRTAGVNLDGRAEHRCGQWGASQPGPRVTPWFLTPTRGTAQDQADRRPEDLDRAVHHRVPAHARRQGVLRSRRCALALIWRWLAGAGRRRRSCHNRFHRVHHHVRSLS